MRLLLDFVYLIICVVLSPWLVYRLCTTGRQDFAARFGAGLGPRVTSSIWLHGSSAGEIAVLRPLVAELERDYPATPLVISAFTSTGLATARKLYARHRVVPLPVDLSFVVRRFLARFDPHLLVVAESEFWPNLIRVAHARGVPAMLVNGKMSAKSFNAHARTRLVASALERFAVLAVQTDEHAQRLARLGVPAERLHVTGNMKYDLAPASSGSGPGLELRAALGYAPTDVVVIGGSLHDQEDAALLDAFVAARAEVEDAALVIVPRYPADADTVAERVEARGLAVTRKTAVDAGAPLPGRSGVLLVDTVGELRRLYAIADLAFVGGSLFYRGANKGGHNLMEPAIHGVPVLFGPYNFSFKETVDDLVAADAGRLVRNPAELRAAVTALVRDRDARRSLGLRAQRVVESGRGATARNYALLKKLLDARP